MSNVINVNVSNDVSSVLVSDTGLRGRPGLVWRGEFSTTTTYYVGDAVSFEGSSYFVSAYSVASATTPNNSANFSVLAQATTGVATATLKTLVAQSTDFEDFQTRIAALV